MSSTRDYNIDVARFALSTQYHFETTSMNVYELIEFTAVALSAMFVIINPLTATFLFLSVVPQETAERQKQLAWLALKVGLSILIAFALLGSLIFQFLGITLGAFKIAGGIILFSISLRMISETKTISESYTVEQYNKAPNSIAIMPLAIPFISGPGSITTVMILSTNATTIWHSLVLILVILLIVYAGYFAMTKAKHIVRFLGDTGKEVLVRMIGLILAVLAVQFVINGITESIHNDFYWLFEIIDDDYEDYVDQIKNII